jgi:hypothetical protein
MVCAVILLALFVFGFVVRGWIEYLIGRNPVLLGILTSSSDVTLRLASRLSFWQFLLLGVLRRLAIDPLWLYVGRHLPAQLVTTDKKAFRWLGRSISAADEKLDNVLKHGKRIGSQRFGFTVRWPRGVESLILTYGFFTFGAEACLAAGIHGISLKKVWAVNIAGTLTTVSSLYLLGGRLKPFEEVLSTISISIGVVMVSAIVWQLVGLRVKKLMIRYWLMSAYFAN